MAPNYRAYAIEQSLPEPDLLESVLQQAWPGLAQPSMSQTAAAEFIARCEQLPLDESRTSPFLSMAQQAVGAVIWMLKDFGDVVDDADQCKRGGKIAEWGVESVKDWVLLTTSSSWERDESNLKLRQLAQLPTGAGALPFARQDNEARRRWLDEHPLIVAERAKQVFDIAVLSAIPALTPEIAQLLRKSSRTQGAQPFLRGLGPWPGPVK
jgi:hypothetical protein